MKERIVIGIHAVNECLKIRPRSVSNIWFQDKYERNAELNKIFETSRKLNIKSEVKNSQILEKFAKTHQGVALFCKDQPEWNAESIYGADGQVLMLDGIEDPHNLGAIFRTGWLMKVSGIIVPQDRATGLTPIVHKSACGGVEHVPILQVPSFSPTIQDLKEQGFWVFGLSHKAKKTLFDVQIPEKIVWALGAEDSGLRTTTEKLCDELISIPQADPNASFNVSVTAGLVCFEYFKKFRAQAFKKP
jgi:23S rRNA (guanosine2251-2'-O)-methyltransferase